MNSNMLHTLASSRVQEIRRESRDRHLAALAQHAAAAPAGAVSHTGQHGRMHGGMRTRVGYTLVEAGLRLVATSGPRG
jgi:hypothetical protein